MNNLPQKHSKTVVFRRYKVFTFPILERKPEDNRFGCAPVEKSCWESMLKDLMYASSTKTEDIGRFPILECTKTRSQYENMLAYIDKRVEMVNLGYEHN